MRWFVPEEKVQNAPEWWSSERYDYCDVIMKKENADNLIGKLIKKVSQLFS